MSELSDEALRALLIEHPERGWRAFVDQYTPALLALIARSGVVDRDEIGEVYVRVCERLAENDCARLRRHDPLRGALAAWLTILVRHAVVDWVRSRAGRRRLFRAIRELAPFEQRVFEMYYWERMRATEIVELLRVEQRQSVDLPAVLDALQRIREAMTDRHRGELLALLARTRKVVSLDALDESAGFAVEPGDDPEQSLAVRELDALFAAALAALPPEDAAIVRLTFVQGWSRKQVRRALHLDSLTRARVSGILRSLREILTARRVGPREAATPGLRFLQEGWDDTSHA